MIYHVGLEPEKIRKFKKELKLSGDVYIYDEIYIESLESHKKLIPDSKATTIEEAYEERVEYERILSEKRVKETVVCEDIESEEE